MKDYPLILSIDTSCDDTSVAVTQGMRVLSNIIASQEEIHRKYGGVMPLEAKLAHHELINPTYQEAIKRARIEPKDLDAIAVTQGPGLAIALEVGIEFAKQISRELNKPLIGVNHMEGHLYSSLAVNSKDNPHPKVNASYFPAIALLISGGHTELVLLQSLQSIKVIGKSVDDAAGEALDKFARMIDLGYPGAAAMEQIAKNGNSTRFIFPLPMRMTSDLNFSFSGLKTSGKRLIEKLDAAASVNGDNLDGLTKTDIEDLAAGFQQAVFRALLYKLKKAVVTYQPKSLWLGGGVSANITLRNILRNYCHRNNLKFLFPYSKKLTTDNAAMVGMAAYFNYLNSVFVNDFDQFQRIPRLDLP